MTKNLTLIETAIQVGAVLNDAIDDLVQDVELNFSDGLPDTRNDLCAAYAALCEALSRELKVDAHSLIQQMIGAELTARRTILTAQTGIRFPPGSVS